MAKMMRRTKRWEREKRIYVQQWSPSDFHATATPGELCRVNGEEVIGVYELVEVLTVTNATTVEPVKVAKKGRKR